MALAVAWAWVLEVLALDLALALYRLKGGSFTDPFREQLDFPWMFKRFSIDRYKIPFGFLTGFS